MILRPATFGLFLLFGFVFAGCLEDAPADYHAGGQTGSFALGWAYDGKDVLAFDGFITIHADPAANTGEALVEGTIKDQHWRIVFDRFAEASGKPFQDGGIATALDEHGNTGVGDTSIPKVHVDIAAWGEALVTIDDKAVPDALTGEERWVAHYMVITTGVRDDQSGGIWNAVRSAPYDPADPVNGLALEGDNEIHLVLKSHATAPPNATAISNKSQTSASPSVMARHTYANQYENSDFNVTVKVTGTYTPLQRLSFTLRDPNGRTVETLQLPQGSRMEGNIQHLFNVTGPYRIDVSGNGVQPGYEITGTLTPPSNVIMNLWWEDVLFGEAAEAFEATAANHTHTDDEMGAPKLF